GPITPEQRKQIIASSPVAGVYEKAVDRDSAYERLTGKGAANAQRGPDAAARASADAGTDHAPATKRRRRCRRHAE
ncbi:MAG TPA: helicase HerA-like domain-containing protein, partial [Acidobacteriaceae bacterium]|nr:helicase HerA-like domain-containing protein [Acidobacteriaceae bacterium]